MDENVLTHTYISGNCTWNFSSDSWLCGLEIKRIFGVKLNRIQKNFYIVLMLSGFLKNSRKQQNKEEK